MENSSFNQCDVFRAVTAMMAETYARKNHDYGNAYTELRREFPDTVLIYMTAKLKRLKTLMQGEPAQVNESIEDTLLDIANYAVMEIVERNRDMWCEAEDGAFNSSMRADFVPVDEPSGREYLMEKAKHLYCRGRKCATCIHFKPAENRCEKFDLSASEV